MSPKALQHPAPPTRTLAQEAMETHTFDQNVALNNVSFDAGQQASTTGNVWTNNTFGTTFGI